MELKRLISHFTYRIEPKPGGGFIAHPADPSVAPLEAPAREELQKKIQENILAGLSAQFPGLKLPLENQDLQFAFHIERKPEGGFVIHSSDPNAELCRKGYRLCGKTLNARVVAGVGRAGQLGRH
jgi:hypothetical protein